MQWAFDTVSGVGHTGWAMYNTKENVNDTFTIAERMLFGMPHHNVPQVAPVADFVADITIVWLLSNPTVQFTNKSIGATSYVWSFGDTTYSTAVNPSHLYTYADTFTVRLRAYNGNGCEVKAKKWDYIIVKDGVGVDEIDGEDLEVRVYPNPATGVFTVAGATGEIQVYDLVGCKGLWTTKAEIDLSSYAKGVYLVKVGETVRKGIRTD